MLPCCLISEEGEKAMNELKVSLREPDGIRQTWLTDEELDLRAGLYNQDGQFQRDIQRLWAECSDILLRISEESWRWEFESADRMNITAKYRSEERLVGKEWVSTFRSR